MTTDNPTGNKYYRKVYDVDGTDSSVIVDVYAVIVGFNVTNPGIQHAIKKLLCAGIRGKGDIVQDLTETLDAVKSAIRIEKQKCLAEKNIPYKS